MSWRDLAFLHWPVPIERLRPFIPAPLEIDTYDGIAWLGVVPFRMANVRPRFCPPVPWLSHFAELNLRTYVTIGDRPGVWFFSLDAANPVAVELARLVFHLPYFNASMRLKPGATTAYTSTRADTRGGQACFVAEYAPCEPVNYARPGTLDHWLTERYCLYAGDQRGRVWRGDIHHAPWPLQRATVTVQANSLASRLDVSLDAPPLSHYVRRLDVLAWLPRRVV